MATASFPNPQTSLRIRTVMIFQPRVPDKECSHVQDLKQYNCMRAHILQCIKKKADQDGSVALQYVVNSANERYKSHPLFPKGACSDLEGSFFCVFRAVFVLHQLSRFQCNGTCESPQSKPMALPLSSNQTLK